MRDRAEVHVASVPSHLQAQTIIISSPSQAPLVRAVTAARPDAEVVLIGQPVPESSPYLGLGTGSVMDFAKRCAAGAGAELTLVPTVLSTDAAFSDVAARRAEDTVHYDVTGSADAVLIDPDLLAMTPWALHLRGLGDLFAITTARRDGQSRAEVPADLVHRAESILDEAIGSASLLRHGSDAGALLLTRLLETKVSRGLAIGSAGLE